MDDKNVKKVATKSILSMNHFKRWTVD